MSDWKTQKRKLSKNARRNVKKQKLEHPQQQGEHKSNAVLMQSEKQVTFVLEPLVIPTDEEHLCIIDTKEYSDGEDDEISSTTQQLKSQHLQQQQYLQEHRYKEQQRRYIIEQEFLQRSQFMIPVSMKS